MNKTDKRIVEIENQLANIEKKKRKYLKALHSVYIENTRYNYYKTNKSTHPEKLETLPSYMSKEIGENIRSGLLTPYTFGRFFVDASIKAKDKKGFMVVPGALCVMLAFPAVVVDTALLPLVLFHNHVTLAAVYGIWGKIAKHRIKKREANIEKINKKISDLRQEKKQLMAEKEKKENGVLFTETEEYKKINSNSVENQIKPTTKKVEQKAEEKEETL